jgi:hypothetical protein
MIRFLFCYCCFFYFLSCSTPHKILAAKYFRDSIPIISFCDLPKYKGQKVYLQSKYAGIDEYWSLFPVDKKCKEKISVELEFKEGIGYIPTQYQNLFDSVYSSYWNTYLLINAVGIFDNDNKNGYGHLGSNNSRFVVLEIIDIKLMKK